ncbi:MAG: hypothetical protein B6D61_02135 [Bacteroidetes bacterium 4484_249]|nr:MAG: hypothetical protein B6D61_02135 [Bacteroidetes bacterium 4484_249]
MKKHLALSINNEILGQLMAKAAFFCIGYTVLKHGAKEQGAKYDMHIIVCNPATHQPPITVCNCDGFRHNRFSTDNPAFSKYPGTSFYLYGTQH